MASYQGYSSDGSDSDVILNEKSLDYSYLQLTNDTCSHNLQVFLFSYDSGETNQREKIENLYLQNNMLTVLPDHLEQLTWLRVLDLSNNSLEFIGQSILTLTNLVQLGLKNNLLTDESSFPKDMSSLANLKELNLSGNQLTTFPPQIADLVNLRYLSMGGNRLKEIPSNIRNIKKLQCFYLGGNELEEIPTEIGCLAELRVLALCENQLQSLPSTVSNLLKLRTLLLHKNSLTTLPPELIKLNNLSELSLRDNPLVVRFVHDMGYDPPSLLELSARAVKNHGTPYGKGDLPWTLFEYLNSAQKCVNPQCEGVYFDTRVEHIRFVDFCGKYRIPLLQYLCSPKCTSSPSGCNNMSAHASRLKKVLLG